MKKILAVLLLSITAPAMATYLAPEYTLTCYGDRGVMFTENIVDYTRLDHGVSVLRTTGQKVFVDMACDIRDINTPPMGSN